MSGSESIYHGEIASVNFDAGIIAIKVDKDELEGLEFKRQDPVAVDLGGVIDDGWRCAHVCNRK